LKILVTGAAGMLGTAVVEVLGREHEVRGVDLPDGDLGEAGVAAELVTEGTGWVVHCAAWTDVDGAESHRQEAQAANAHATSHLAAACAERTAGLTYVSTDYVFDGRGTDGGYDEDAPRDPLNHYGLTKVRGEESVEALATPWQIVRTSWLFGDGRVNFVKTIRRLLGERETLQVVDDQRGCPTFAPDLAEVIGFLVTRRGHGIFHGTNAGDCTWYGFAREVARGLGADPQRIRSCGSDAYPTAAARPVCSVLRSRRLEEAGCPPRPDWRDAVARYLALLEGGRARHP